MTGDHAAALQEDRQDAEPRLRRSERRHPRRHGHRGPDGAAKFVQEGGTLITEGSTATIFPEYGLTQRRHGRDAGAAVRARLDPARHVADTKSPLAYGFDARRAAGLLQPGSGAERRWRRHSGGVRRLLRRRRRGQCRPRARTSRRTRLPRAHLAVRRRKTRRRARPAAAGRMQAAEFRQHGRASSASASTTRARAWCCRSRRTRRHAALGHARRRPVPRRTARGCSTRRSARVTS